MAIFPTIGHRPFPFQPYEDVIVIGSGAAGLTFALEASKFLNVTIFTKDRIRESNTLYAQGGLAAALRLEDDYNRHFQDTLEAGGGINDELAVQILVHEAPARVRELQHYGVEFDSLVERGLSFTREGGHTEHRIIHVGDLTGLAIEEALVNQVNFHRRIRVFERIMVKDLIVDDGVCYGVSFLDPTGSEQVILTRAVLLAAGGIGEVYAKTTNPRVATGDGIAMAARAGVELQDMEFVQFHPTAFHMEGHPTFLVSEALRGEGALLVDRHGRRIMEDIHPLKELAPRDIVAREIYLSYQRGDGPVSLDIRHKDESWLENRFPFITSRCKENGINPARDLIPVSPAAHYVCGGILTDIDGRTAVKGLYSAGECARTGVHGANRLASNSLLESLVFGYRSAIHAERYIKYLGPDWYDRASRFEALAAQKIRPEKPVLDVSEYRRRIQEITWQHAGIVRTDDGLREGLAKLAGVTEEIESIQTDAAVNRESIEVKNLCAVANSILQAALARRENVGTHYNLDLV